MYLLREYKIIKKGGYGQVLLVVDIGNTNITLGVFDGDENKMIARMATEKSKTADQYAV